MQVPAGGDASRGPAVAERALSSSSGSAPLAFGPWGLSRP